VLLRGLGVVLGVFSGVRVAGLFLVVVFDG
jgi:hypothetical protein